MRQSSPGFAMMLSVFTVSLSISGPVPGVAAEPICAAPATGYQRGEAAIRIGGAVPSVEPPLRKLLPFAPLMESGVVRRVRLPANKKVVALTFDLCEQANEISGYQGAIVEYLRRESIAATFFVSGKWLFTHRERGEQLVVDPLFAVGNHGWEHRNLRLLEGVQLVQEIVHSQMAYEEVRERALKNVCLFPNAEARKTAMMSKRRQSLYRFPFGACSAESLREVSAQGLRAIQWDVSSGDPWIGATPQKIVDAVMSGVRPGSIILFHANGRGRHTEAAVPMVIEQLKMRGYGFVRVDDLLAMGEPEYAGACYDARPGDTDKYDVLAQRIERRVALWRERSKYLRSIGRQ